MESAKDNWRFITIPSIPEKIPYVEELLAEVLLEDGFSEDDVFGVRLALDEALANAIRHGNGRDPEKKVRIRFRIANGRVTIRVRDEGRGFDYDNLPDPTSPERIELPNGRGLLLMNSYMDSVTFSRKGNEVTMVKGREFGGVRDETT